MERQDFAELGPGVPTGLLGGHSVGIPVDHVAIDNVLAAKIAVEHLVGIGRRRIAAIGDSPRGGTAALRLEGYHAALAEAGLPRRPELVMPTLEYHRRNGAVAMAALLDLPEPPDAVFCFNDPLAIGALHIAAERGLRVPEDVAVVGFDNTEESVYSTPSLTTIAPDKAAIAQTAVELIRRRSAAAHSGETGEAGEAFAPQDIQTPFTLEIRKSTVSGR